MTVDTETVLLKFLERIEAEAKETNRKLDKLIEDTNLKFDRVIQDVNDVQVNQARLEGKIETLQVEIKNVKEDVKEIKTELKETRNEVSGLYKWFIATIITAGIGAGTLLLKAFDFFPFPKT
jgi:peptidoglycan hydrolase CwlO-like protein